MNQAPPSPVTSELREAVTAAVAAYDALKAAEEAYNRACEHVASLGPLSVGQTVVGTESSHFGKPLLVDKVSFRVERRSSRFLLKFIGRGFVVKSNGTLGAYRTEHVINADFPNETNSDEAEAEA